VIAAKGHIVEHEAACGIGFGLTAEAADGVLNAYKGVGNDIALGIGYLAG
jgi:hypothetical protein